VLALAPAASKRTRFTGQGTRCRGDNLSAPPSKGLTTDMAAHLEANPVWGGARGGELSTPPDPHRADQRRFRGAFASAEHLENGRPPCRNSAGAAGAGHQYRPSRPARDGARRTACGGRSAQQDDQRRPRYLGVLRPFSRDARAHRRSGFNLRFFRPVHHDLAVWYQPRLARTRERAAHGTAGSRRLTERGGGARTQPAPAAPRFLITTHRHSGGPVLLRFTAPRPERGQCECSVSLATTRNIRHSRC